MLFLHSRRSRDHIRPLTAQGDPELSFFAVYDGHGGTGVANYLKDHLHEFILSQEVNTITTITTVGSDAAWFWSGVPRRRYSRGHLEILPGSGLRAEELRQRHRANGQHRYDGNLMSESCVSMAQYLVSSIYYLLSSI